MSEPHSEPAAAKTPRVDPTEVIPLGHDVLVIQDRYETLSIANDVLIGIWFVVGTCLFFAPVTLTAGRVLFLIGSVQMCIRPVIRLRRRIHLRHRGYPGSTTQQDF